MSMVFDFRDISLIEPNPNGAWCDALLERFAILARSPPVSLLDLLESALV